MGTGRILATVEEFMWPGTMGRQGGESQDSGEERMSDDLIP